VPPSPPPPSYATGPIHFYTLDPPLIKEIDFLNRTYELLKILSHPLHHFLFSTVPLTKTCCTIQLENADYVPRFIFPKAEL